VRLGTSKVLIPAPEGFEEATTQFESIRTRFAATESPTNEMLLAHLKAEDCDLLRNGQAPTMLQYTKVSVLRAAKEQAFSQADLAAVISEFRKNGAAMMDPNSPGMKRVLDNIEQGLKKIDSATTSVEMTQPVNLGEFEVAPNIYSVMLLLTFKSGAGELKPILATMSYMRVQQRLLYAFAYRQYTSRADIETLRIFAKAWTARILAAN
jgi:hypothetical protein